jgi:uncharacterized membrane protein
MDRFETSPLDMMERIDPTEEIFLGDLDDGGPTQEVLVDPLEARLRKALDELGDAFVSTTLPMPARDAFEAFCDVEATPRWVSVIKSVKVVSWNPAGRPKRAAFLARLERASIGYTLHYRYDEYQRMVTWGTAPGSTTVVAGRAQFVPLGDRACLMQYQLELELPAEALPPWEDPFFSGHAASVVMNDFRDFVLRARGGGR